MIVTTDDMDRHVAKESRPLSFQGTADINVNDWFTFMMVGMSSAVCGAQLRCSCTALCIVLALQRETILFTISDSC